MEILSTLEVIIKIVILIILISVAKTVLYDVHMLVRDARKLLDRKIMVNEEMRRHHYLKNMERQYDLNESSIPYAKRGYEYINKTDISQSSKKSDD